MPPIRIRYHRLWGPLLLTLAAINIAVFAVGGGPIQLGLGMVFGLMGALYLVQAFLVLADGTLTVKNLFGLTLRRFAYGRLADLEVERDAIVLSGPTGRQRLKLSLIMIRRADLDALAEAVRAARAAAPPAPADAT
jgi:hypothetical protein